ncbi:hypothetical protein E4U38_001389 [Claviceps purpurea]|nr:hypothetical protein E4U38_001389 [Claviceps purpurea]KAG6169020.1 hypothetical protein E4U11_004870 [Claviceps purpurea]KAG6253343.1 hypothetical protein E4U23_007844 [Claviceps purpurea]KAG6310575.1 hypothetical protein E4U44_005372 [Claviceps purpurea]
MNSPEGRGSLLAQPGRRPWTSKEDDILLQFKEGHEGWTEISNILPGRSIGSCQVRYQLLKNEWEWSELEETNNKISMLYERLKEDMWSQIATEMSMVWSEVESMHWHLGKAQLRRRGTDDSFRMTRVNLPPPSVDDAQVAVQAPREQQDQRQQQQQQGARRPALEWSGDEEISLFAYRGDGMSWQDIAKLLPGRTTDGCRRHYTAQTSTGPAWPQERKNELCKRYERLKRNMWAKIGDVLKIPWQSVESIHWRLGAEGMAQRAEFMEERAGAALSSQAAFGLAPPEEDNAEVHQPSDEERDQSSHYPQYPQYQTEPAPMAHEGWPGSSVTVPGILEFDEGVKLLHQQAQRETYGRR